MLGWSRSALPNSRYSVVSLLTLLSVYILRTWCGDGVMMRKNRIMESRRESGKDR
jgi:hypothetical protein